VPDVIVPVTWVQQETTYFCGPAAAQMALASLGAAQPATPPPWQEQLWADVQARTNEARPAAAGPGTPDCPAFPTQRCEKVQWDWKCWSTTPPALERVLNLRQSRATCAVSTHPTERAATRALLDAIDAGIPGVALVFGWQHWLVVDGYLHDPTASSTNVGHRHVDGVYLRDSNAEEALHYVTWTRWTDDYLRFVPAGTYRDTIVVIGAVPRPVSPPSPPQAPDNVRIGTQAGGGQMAKMARRNLAVLITAEEAVHRAQTAAQELLRRSDRWRIALVSADPGTPLCVQRLDLDDSYYYIVPYRIKTRETARLIVDAATGQFTDAGGIETHDASLAPYVDPVAALERYHGRSLELPGVGKRIIRPGTVGHHPVAVWKPCRQSTSPSSPFFQMSVGDRLVYLSADGRKWFDALTTGIA
jgi:hypothetical protein